jgi:hypothetical protein
VRFSFLGKQPLAISTQNCRWISRRCDGAPGDFIGERPVNSFIHPAGLPINTSVIEVLRRSVESAMGLYKERCNSREGGSLL